jgi:uncharacterized protein (UPF0210 family)
MKIRTITCFYNPVAPEGEKTLDVFSKLLKDARVKFETLGFDVQTTRIATTPFPNLVKNLTLDSLLSILVPLEKSLLEKGFDYVSFGPALPEFPNSYGMIPKLLAQTENAFYSAVIAASHRVYFHAVKETGKIIRAAAPITPDGFTNLRFTALANVDPFGPFFPAAYHDGTEPAFALAIESADLAEKAFERADSLIKARDLLIKSIEHHASQMRVIAEELSAEYRIIFKGMDFSLAPFPVDTCSLGGAIEQLGVEKIGQMGSLAAAAIVAETLDRGAWLRTGFNGLMLPMLEDSILAQRSIEGTLTIKDLLLYSAVCGTGLDTVPLPGDATAGQISAVLADIATLSSRLSKPLTARLMPVPGKMAGDMTEFDFEFFKNGRVLDLPAAPLRNFLDSDEVIEIKHRNPS